MSDIIQKLVLSIFGENPILATIFISMIPVIELRGAIPFGSSKEIWGEKALSIFEASVYSVIGSILAAVAIILLMIPLFKLLRKTKLFNRLVDSLEAKFKKKGEKINMNSKTNHIALKKWFGVMTFVAVPLPLTGVWTGSAVAVFLEMGFMKSFTAISAGTLIAAVIMMVVSNFLGEKALVVFYAFVVALIVLMVFYILRAVIKNKKNIEVEKA